MRTANLRGVEKGVTTSAQLELAPRVDLVAVHGHDQLLEAIRAGPSRGRSRAGPGA